MEYTDKDLKCQDCNGTFVFSADDQSYHEQKGFTNEPKRCTSCRSERRDQRRGGGGGGRFGGGGGGGDRVQHAVVCSDCGKDTTVPFKPRGDRPVYCSECFNKQRSF